jgi:hypothetical protein
MPTPIATKIPLARRAPSCSGSHGENNIAVAAPTQW